MSQIGGWIHWRIDNMKIKIKKETETAKIKVVVKTSDYTFQENKQAIIQITESIERSIATDGEATKRK